MPLSYHIKKKTLSLSLSGDYIGYDNEIQKSELLNTITSHISEIIIDASDLKKWDSSFVVILYKVIELAKQKKIKITYHHVPIELKHLLGLALTIDVKPTQKHKTPLSFLETLGTWGIRIFQSIKKG